jgi:DNA-binding transcriptional LysR family regulator
MDLDLRRLRYFVTVAEELSFIRAAMLLHMTQPGLSRQISALEHDLGAQLFERDRRGTSLTPAGQQLLEDALPLLAAASAMERRTRLAGREPTRFAIGFMPGTNATPLIREFARRVPYLSIDVVFTTVTDQVDFLIDGRVDVCFVRLPLAENTFKVLPLFPEPRVAAVPASHPVAGSPAIGVKQVFVLPAGIADFYRRADISYVPLQDVAARMVALAYNKHRTMPELEQFAQLTTSLLGAGPGPELAG